MGVLKFPWALQDISVIQIQLDHDWSFRSQVFAVVFHREIIQQLKVYECTNKLMLQAFKYIFFCVSFAQKA
jgi:hypothetical protein